MVLYDYRHPAIHQALKLAFNFQLVAMSLESQDDPAYQNFLKAMTRKSEKTKENYIWALERYRKANFVDQYSFMLEGQQAEKEDKIKAYLATISYSHAKMFIGAMRLFFAANRILIDWDHVLLFLPEGVAKVLRGYEKPEITSVLKIAKLREQCAILVMSTAGLRIGALPALKVENLTWMDEQRTYCLTVYAGDAEEEYQTFCTPQTAQLLKKYIGKRSKGPVFTAKYEAEYPADEDSLSCAIDLLLNKAGVKKPGLIQTTHGFRKFFRTTLEVSGIHDDFAERLMGHSKEKLKKVYSHPQPLELWNVSQYQKAIPALTFDI